MTVKATLVDSLSHESAPGAFKYYTHNDGFGIKGMIFKCPCGCDDLGTLNFDPLETPRPCWQWDGNRDTPTLSPSVRKVGTCAWHGWLRAGQWEEA